MEGPPVHDNVIETLRLMAEGRSFKPQMGRKSAEVTALQRALIGLGFRLNDDGFWGPLTSDAVRSLQEKLDFEPTGQPNPELVRILLDLLQNPGMQEEFSKKVGPVSQEATTSAEQKAGEPVVASATRGQVLPHTISDGAVRDVSQDSLGFTSYVYGLQQFLAAEETRPPLAIGITARWGQGKTSFMRMLETELERPRKAGPRFVSSWFNPWLYSDPEQLWNAFVSNISSCILHALPRGNRFLFHYRRFRHNLEQRVGFGIRFWLGLLMILSTLGIFLYAVCSDLGGTAMLDMAGKYIGPDTKELLTDHSTLPFLLSVFGAVFLASIFYYRVVKKLDFGLIDYLQKKDFSVKAGALVQFQNEMELLAEAIPDDLRVVVFIDDLDRCEEKILMEVISSLQVLTVSSKCYFVLGLDLAIVARQIEGSVLAQALEQTDEKQHPFQHGSGFRFLEKVIQARLSVPPYDHEEIRGMVERLLPKSLAVKTGEEDDATAVKTVSQAEVAQVVRVDDPAIQPPEDEEVLDAPEIGEALVKYGPVYFDNPRSLKRFMNSFRMHAHLATVVDNGISTDQLARYFVLAECWPGLLDYFKHNPQRLMAEGKFVPLAKEQGTGGRSLEKEIDRLMEGAAGGLFREQPALDGDTIVHLCKWYGFRFYRAERFSTP
ncbi:Putative peptidoglycan binding domain-containing protein [Malonomonas rubra DSM 5091]|uniref:Putative peptidoglycan binding domain-containing protein n=1 Tax=Malonomonas rubra DSM 5091 TaxID=1122189 RepID=A0A1M6N3J6_MALRU|nr:P-loop NTPase fold protein [Malonomonas rubra]SHJ90237.1 Putative peptidoglycan binding domain-containing protein [Malonomonas rubra DSM 5091]